MARFTFQGKEVTAQPEQPIPTTIGSVGSSQQTINWIVDGQTVQAQDFVQHATPLDSQASQLWNQYLGYYNQLPSKMPGVTSGTSGLSGSQSR